MSPPSSDLFGRTLTSLFWQFLGVGGQRVVQLIAPIVLWRLLPDTDIGLFAIVLAGIGVIESLTTFVGEQTSIWSDRGADRRYLDTVFTVRVLRGILISSILVPLAWPFAWFFEDPATAARYWLPGLFLMLAVNGAVDALQSPARAARMKGLDFRRVALGDFVSSLVGIGVTLLLAWHWRDVWALVIGHLVSTAARTVASYIVAPHLPRPRFDRGALRELFHYNIGAAGTPFLLLMIFTAGPLVLGKVISKGAVAVYDGAGRLAKLPEDIFLRVLAPVAIPAYAQVKDDPDRLGRAWSRAMRAFLLVGTPLTVALAWCGDALPTVVFGEKYIAIPGLFALLSIHGGLAGLTSVVGPLFWAIGKPQWDRTAQFFRAIVIYGAGIPAAYYGGVIGFAAVSCLAILAALWFSVRRALRHLDLRLAVLFQAARGGAGFGALLFGALLLIDLIAAPTGWWRVIASGLVAGPLLGVLCLRLLKRQTPKAPSTAPAEAPAQPEPSTMQPDPAPEPPQPTAP